MGRSRCVAFVLLVGLIIISAGPACAWEFNLSTTSTYSYLYYSQRGTNGFFGQYNRDGSTGVTDPWGGSFSIPSIPLVGTPGPFTLATFGGSYGSVNGWLGTQVADLVTGTDASKSSVSTSLYPEFRANNAVKLAGIYRIGNSDTYQFPGATVSFANGEWLQWWVLLDSPWGLLSYGKRAFGFGCGLQYDTGSRTEEYITAAVPYGPIKIGLGFYPWRDGSQLNNFNATDTALDGGAGESVYYNKYDKSNTTIYDLFAFLEYSAGPLEVGLGTMIVDYSLRPEGNPVVNAALGGGTPPNFAKGWIPPMDRRITEGWIYMKYSDGRFFFNAEADWNYGTVRWQSSLSNVTNQPFQWEPERTNGSGSIFRPLYTQSWRYMAEFGAVCGPVKASFLYAYVPGPDRRHGVLIDRQPVNVDLFRPGRDVPVYNQDQGNATLFRPYSMLLSTAYGAGLGAVDRSSNGFIVDASVLATRLDYAVAANLNIFGSFVYANRVSHGHGWGYIRPMVLGTSFADNFHATRVFTYYSNTRARATEFGDPSPAIPDNNLGWEVDAGIDWKLLEGWNVGIYAGYWQPGKWFNFACIDKSVPGWDAPSSANLWGTNPDRSIDPVFALNVSMAVNF